MNSTIILRFHDQPQPLVPKIKPRSSATFAHVIFIFLIVFLCAGFLSYADKYIIVVLCAFFFVNDGLMRDAS